MGSSKTSPSRPRRRRWMIALGVSVVLVFAGTFALRTPSPVGHWNSAEGHEDFLSHYEQVFAEFPQRPNETFDIRTDYGTVRVYHFEGSGDAEAPLVLLPGRASASPVWAGNMESMLEIGDVYTLDLLGEAGMSVQERPIRDDDAHAEWLHQTLEGLPSEAYTLVGLSIGGWTATNLATRQPDLISSVVLLDPVYVFDEIPLSSVIRSIPAAVSWLPKSWRDGFTSYISGGIPVEDEPVAWMIESGMNNYTLKLSAPTTIPEEALAELDVPVLVFLGGESVMHDPETSIPLAEQVLPEGSVRHYPDASHAINGEYPDEIAADIAEFLNA